MNNIDERVEMSGLTTDWISQQLEQLKIEFAGKSIAEIRANTSIMKQVKALLGKANAEAKICKNLIEELDEF